jgi:hypothetical protein
MRNRLPHLFLQSAILSAVLCTAAPAQTPPSSGWTCRGAWSANAAGKEFGFVWVRLNADDTADLWTTGGSAVPPDSIPAAPPASAHHQSAGQVSHFGSNVVGVTYQPPKGNPAMVMIDRQNHMLSTPRQKAPIACTP